MRLILFAGKGGSGKTSMSAATAALAAQQGLNTLVISLDPAHSLSDAFDLEGGLLDLTGEPVQVAPNLAIQEINVNVAIKQYWDQVHSYLSALFNSTGLQEVVAEEIAVLPGMEEISALLYINQYVRDQTYDLMILDCAPTAESMRFVSVPSALEWYMKKVFKLERTVLKVARPIAARLTDVPLPGDDYFANLEALFKKLEGVDRLLTDHESTTVRLVCNPEKMVLKESQRAYTYFSLYGLAVEAVIMNRVWPADAEGLGRELAALQKPYLAQAEQYFAPLPILPVEQKRHEVLGVERLLELGRELYGQADPAARLYDRQPLAFIKQDGRLQVRLHLPSVDKTRLKLHKVGDELVVEVGVFRKHLALPHSFALARPTKAVFHDDDLLIDFSQPGGES
ncbi:MAG: TRC40/GET3/ArsA family transport-energizing ATPase [Desulfarculaceae bacterium]|nr:TRC40/GET3/ArsA family transport-energizing ATPase [Desulfarculaceae bacterium]MCF8073863.1 TRC40/GET3/ArsA family transport-energizing ATPase [Desulfarculaceae bacterium]MCF8102843.1 TRC40/GET3/ArsA family transport-energizing ATPase [Desulfarculaceae bacterium]MCF8116287.1 TRC40/GET3/ArsA family transport-energizing ATPase [Desulfarculaceae bacterium]